MSRIGHPCGNVHRAGLTGRPLAGIRIARRRLITATARTLAEREGWDSVTTRRLSNEIEYSQPVLYKHFGSMEDIVEAVALEGFGELAETLGAARRSADAPEDELARVAAAFSSFANENPALYDAMFTRATDGADSLGWPSSPDCRASSACPGPCGAVD